MALFCYMVTTDTNEQDTKIDRLVYKLYGLTPEEISAVEGSKQQR